jgi:hypothetical protein
LIIQIQNLGGDFGRKIVGNFMRFEKRTSNEEGLEIFVLQNEKMLT